MTSTNGRPERPGSAIKDGLGWTEGPEHLERDLQGCHDMYQIDPSTTYAAFQAIRLIAAASNRTDLGEMTKIGVPWWVLSVLWVGWMKYIEDPDQSTMGKAFGLEATGQGSRRAVEKNARLVRALNMVLEVVTLTDRRGQTLESAIEAVSLKHSLSPDTLKGMWKSHHKRVREILQRRQAGPTSSSTA